MLGLGPESFVWSHWFAASEEWVSVAVELFKGDHSSISEKRFNIAIVSDGRTDKWIVVRRVRPTRFLLLFVCCCLLVVFGFYCFIVGAIAATVGRCRRHFVRPTISVVFRIKKNECPGSAVLSLSPWYKKLAQRDKYFLILKYMLCRWGRWDFVNTTPKFIII